MDLVVILLDFADETWALTPPMRRWWAEVELRGIGQYGLLYEGKRVVRALLIPREETVH